jgi:hypothetical protein
MKVNIYGCVRIEPREFGWEQETYYEPEEKASYAMAFAAESSRSGEFFGMLEEVIKEHTGCNTVIFDKEEDGGKSPDFGYIDHQSQDVCAKAFESKEALKEFLFNPESYVETDNDNH